MNEGLFAATNTITAIINMHDLQYEDMTQIFALLIAQHLTIDDANEARVEVAEFSTQVLRRRRELLVKQGVA